MMRIISIFRTLYKKTITKIQSYLIVRELKEFYDITSGIVDQLERYIENHCLDTYHDDKIKTQITIIRLKIIDIKCHISNLCENKEKYFTKDD
jgi:hypothetical protein